MEPFSYQIKRTARASKTRIVVSLDKIEVVAPMHVADAVLHQFVREQGDWILQAMQRLKTRAPQASRLAPESYRHGASIPYQGNTFPLMLSPSRLKRIKIEHSDVFTAHIPHARMETVSSDEVREAVIRWMKSNVKSTVEQMVMLHGVKHRLYPRSIAIKTQKSRWGSCGIHDDIAINWLLALAPLEILEYVVVHELCHIKEKNHSPMFWNLVSEHLPHYRASRQWLKQHGRVLMQGL